MDLFEQELHEFTKQYLDPQVDIDILKIAFTHKSYANEIRNISPEKLSLYHNERLEFLGDSILGMIIGEELFLKYPEYDEGLLTKYKARAVCEATLKEIGEALEIGQMLMMGKGEQATGGKRRSSNIADTLEAVVAAVFISCGYKVTKNIILYHWGPYLTGKKIAKASIDYKSELQEYLVKNKKIRPEYRVLSSTGPDHDKEYTIGLFLEDQKALEGKGKSKKKAEQYVAEQYLALINRK